MRIRLTSLCVALALWLAHDVLIAGQALRLTGILDQQQNDTRGVGSPFNGETWVGQTFVPGIGGGLSRLELSLFCSACVCPSSSVDPEIIVEVRTVSGGVPTALVLATTAITGFCSNPPPRAVFTEPPRLSAGTAYAFTLHTATLRANGTYAARTSPVQSAYPNGNRVGSTNNGVLWTINGSGLPSTPRDLAFTTFMMLAQQIDFAPLPRCLYGEPDFTVAATVKSGLPVSFSASGACAVSGTTVHITSVGSCAITATQEGNDTFLPADPVTQTFAITYAPDGPCLGSPGHQVLPPLNADGSNVVRQNATVPVKFRVCDFNGVSVGTPGVVTSFTLQRVIEGTGTTDVDLPPVPTNSNTAFRWDPVDQQWIFNLSTKNLAAGATYLYRITLDDRSSIEFSVGVR